MACNVQYEWEVPKTLPEWEAQKTAKITAMVDICQHHLAEDGRPPLRVQEDVPPVGDNPRGNEPPPEQATEASSSTASTSTAPTSIPIRQATRQDTLIYDTTAPKDPRPPLSLPDKIVMYVAFPSTLTVLLPVSLSSILASTISNLRFQILALFGLKYIEVTGRLAPAARAAALKAFEQGGRDDPRILILSNVGMVGLNIACANILIIVVRSVSISCSCCSLHHRTRSGRLKRIHSSSVGFGDGPNRSWCTSTG